MRRRCALVPMLALGLLSAPVSAYAQAAPDLQPSVDLPAELDRVLRDYERHWQAGEADALAALFVPEGLIVRGGTWIRGRDAIRAAYESAGGPLRLRAVEFAKNDDLGYILGAYGYGDEPTFEDGGLFVLTLRKDAGGRWLIVSDMDRSGSD